MPFFLVFTKFMQVWSWLYDLKNTKALISHLNNKKLPIYIQEKDRVKIQAQILLNVFKYLFSLSETKINLLIGTMLLMLVISLTTPRVFTLWMFQKIMVYTLPEYQAKEQSMPLATPIPRASTWLELAFHHVIIHFDLQHHQQAARKKVRLRRNWDVKYGNTWFMKKIEHMKSSCLWKASEKTIYLWRYNWKILLATVNN